MGIGCSPGDCYIHSESNPEWNANIEVEYLAFSAGIPKELQLIIDEKVKVLGQPPDDLEWGGCKY